MKIIKKIIVFVIIFLICRVVYVYRKSNVPKTIPDFAGIQFERSTEDNVENLYFGKDNSFIYNLEDGQAIGDYDLCSTYTYSKKENIITLNCEREAKKVAKKIHIIKYENAKIELKFDSETRTFMQKNLIK